MDVLFLIAYIVLPVLTFWRTRSAAWTVIALTASVSVFGVLVSFSIDHVRLLSRVDLQVTLLVALLVPAVIAFLRPPHREAPVRRQLLAIGVPFVAIAGVPRGDDDAVDRAPGLPHSGQLPHGPRGGRGQRQMARLRRLPRLGAADRPVRADGWPAAARACLRSDADGRGLAGRPRWLQRGDGRGQHRDLRAVPVRRASSARASSARRGMDPAPHCRRAATQGAHSVAADLDGRRWCSSSRSCWSRRTATSRGSSRRS